MPNQPSDSPEDVQEPQPESESSDSSTKSPQEIVADLVAETRAHVIDQIGGRQVAGDAFLRSIGEPTEAELRVYMRAETRKTLENPNLTPQQRAQIYQGAKKRWRAAKTPPRDPQVQKHTEAKLKSDEELGKATKRQIKRETDTAESSRYAAARVMAKIAEDLRSVSRAQSGEDRVGSLLDEIHRREDRDLRERELKARSDFTPSGSEPPKQVPPQKEPWHKRGDLVLAALLALGAAVLTIALVILPPTSPKGILFWLVIMSVLVVASWLLLSRFYALSRLPAISGCVIALCFVTLFGWYAWPEPKSAEVKQQPSQQPLLVSPLPSPSTSAPFPSPFPSPSPSTQVASQSQKTTRKGRARSAGHDDTEDILHGKKTWPK